MGPAHRILFSRCASLVSATGQPKYEGVADNLDAGRDGTLVDMTGIEIETPRFSLCVSASCLY
jgi:hypothetical protein